MGICNIITNKVLPFVVFPAVSFYAYDLIFGHALSAGTFPKLSVHCKASAPYRVAYTGIPRLDAQLCFMVAFFQLLMDPQNLSLNVELMTCLAAVATIPYFEAARQNSNILLEFQWIIGILYQKFTGGVMLPVYWLLFIVTGAATLHHTPQASKSTKIDQKHAESIVFALVVGYVAPTISMLVFTNQYVTAFWQAFPLWMYIAHVLYLFVRPASRTSGATTVALTYVALFLLSAIPHLYFVMPLFFSPETFKSLFAPSLTSLDPINSTLEQGVLDFIQWDGAMIVLGAFVTTLWVAERSVKGIVGLLAWWVVSVALFGPGASIVGVFWWREGLFNKAGKGSGPKKDEMRRKQ
jgi:hypothetical protein